MASMTPQEIDLFDSLRRAITTLTTSLRQPGASASASGSRSHSFDAAQIEAEQGEYYRSLRKTVKSVNSHRTALDNLADQAKSIFNNSGSAAATTDEALAAYNKSINASSTFMNHLNVELQKLKNKSIPLQKSALEDFVGGASSLSTSLGQASRKASLLSASFIDSTSDLLQGTHSFVDFSNKITSSYAALDQGFLKQAGLLDEITGKISKDLTGDDLVQSRLKLGNAQTLLAESFSGLTDTIGADGLAQFLEDLKSHDFATATGNLMSNAPAGVDPVDLNNKVTEAMATAASHLAKAGFEVGLSQAAGDLDENLNLTSQGLAKLTGNTAVFGKQIAKTSTSIGAAVVAIDKSAAAAVGPLGKLLAQTNPKDLGGFLGTMTKIGAAWVSVGRAVSSTKAVTDKLGEFNIAGLPATFMDTQKAAAVMGMSFEDTIKFMQENKQVIGLYSGGQKKFVDDFKGTFKKFGYSMAQGAEMIGPAMQSAIASGVDVRSQDGLKNYMDQTMESFGKLRGIVDLSAAQYVKLNTELLASKDVQDAMIGMNAAQSKAYADSTIAARDLAIGLGQSTEQAQQMAKLQAGQRREGVVGRMRESMMLGMFARQNGMSEEDTSRLQQLRGKTNLSKDEKIEETKLLAKLNVLKETNYNEGGVGVQAVQDKMLGMMGSASKDMMDATTSISQKEKANAVPTPEEAKKLSAAAQPSSKIAETLNTVNTLDAVVNNSFIAALVAMAGSTAVASASTLMLATSAAKAATSLLGIGGGAVPPGGPPGGPRTRGRFGTAIRSPIAKGLLMFGLGGALAFGGSKAVAGEVPQPTGTPDEIPQPTGTPDEIPQPTITEKTETPSKVSENLTSGGTIAATGAMGMGVAGSLGVKGLTKLVPGLGLLAGGLFAASRAMEGDFVGAGIDLAAGVASLVPGIGTAAAVALEAANVSRDAGVWGDKDGSKQAASDAKAREYIAQKAEDKRNAALMAKPLVLPAYNQLSLGEQAIQDKMQAVMSEQTARDLGLGAGMSLNQIALRDKMTAQVNQATYTPVSVGQVKKSDDATVNKKTSSETIGADLLSVTDQLAQQKLSTISESLESAVAILQQILTAAKEETPVQTVSDVNMRRVLSTRQYTTGSASA